MIKNGTGGLQHQLKSGGDTEVTIAPGGNKTFQLNDLPDRAPTGPLALFLSCLLLTISGSVVQPESAGVGIPRDRLSSLLIDSIDWDNSWMGKVFSSDFISGSNLPVVEYVSHGFSNGQRQINPIASAGATYPFSFTVAIPALNDMRGRLLKETSHLALLFQPSKVKVTLQPASVLDAYSDGATWGTLTASITAQLDPRQELVLGTPMEWILHQQLAGGPQVLIKGFGRDSAMTGVEAKGGVAFLAELTDANGQGGVLPAGTMEAVSNIAFQWRGQGPHTDIRSWINQFIALLPNDRPQTPVDGSVDGPNDYNKFPYTLSKSGATTANVDINDLLFFPWVMGGEEVDLTDLQSADSDQTWIMNRTGGFSSGDHLQLAQYARIWQATKRADWIAQIVRGKESSLAAHVLGGADAVAASLKAMAMLPDGLARRQPNLKHLVTQDQRTYLPWMLPPVG